MRPWIRLAALLLLLITIYLIWCLFLPVQQWNAFNGHRHISNHMIALPPRAPAQCTYSTCFDSAKCARENFGRPLNRIGVYVYPNSLGSLSRQFISLVKAIRTSRYAVHQPSEACVFLPQVDLLNADRTELGQNLRLLGNNPLWNSGVNHLLFNILPGKMLFFSGQSILAGASHTLATYRPTFDVAIPAYNSLLQLQNQTDTIMDMDVKNRSILLTLLPARSTKFKSRMDQVLSAYRDPRVHGENQTIVLLQRVGTLHQSSSNKIPRFWATVSENPYRTGKHTLVDYEDTLARSVFCAIVRADRLGYLGLFDTMALGCIPIIADDSMVLPFSEVLDWSRIAVRIRSSELQHIVTYISTYSPAHIRQIQRQIRFVHHRYMSGLDRIALTTLDIINDRVFPYYARSYVQWNNPNHVENSFPSAPVLFYPPRIPSQSGFTVLIRGHDHFALLYTLLEQIQYVRRLTRIVVVWTNVNVTIPPRSLWPSLRVPLSVVPSITGTIHGRYYPYAQLTTEGVLSLDDHTCAPSAQEIELAFELWSHNPSRLVGLGSQREWYVNITTNSVPVTQPRLISAGFGGTFFHKYYLHAYTELLSPSMQTMVNQARLCEDLLLNWLIVQLSGRSVLTTVNASKNVPSLVRLSSPTVQSFCHLRPYGACWSSLVQLQSFRLFDSAIPFQIAPFSVDLM